VCVIDKPEARFFGEQGSTTASVPAVWIVNLMEELGIECLVGHPAQIRAAAPRKQKNDRRDADFNQKMI
jgi:hypothetical protein